MLNKPDEKRLETAAARVAAPSQPRPMTKTFADARADLEFLRPSQVAELLRISRVSVYRLIERGCVPVYRIFRCVRFKREDILDFLERNRAEAWQFVRYGGETD